VRNEPRGEEDSREGGLVRDGDVEVLGRSTKLTEGYQCSTADPFDIEVADRSLTERLEEFDRQVQLVGYFREELWWWRLVGVEQVPDLEFTVGSSDAECCGDEFVLAGGFASGKVEARETGSREEGVGGNPEVAWLGPSVCDPLGERCLDRAAVACTVERDQDSFPAMSVFIDELVPPLRMLNGSQGAVSECAFRQGCLAGSFVVASGEDIALQVAEFDCLVVDEVECACS
jgi:hypothetical protein